MLESTVPAALLASTISAKPDLTRPKQLAIFLGYGVFLAPALASFLGSCVGSYSARLSLPSWHDFVFWFVGDALGMATITPLYLAFHAKHSFNQRPWTEVALFLIGLSLVTTIVFWQTHFPFLFIVMLMLLIVGVRLGLAGSALGLLFVSVMGGFLTTINHGPIGLMTSSLPPERDLTFQLFIVLSMLLLYVIEVVTSERRRLQSSLEGSERRFRQLAETSSDLIILEDLNGQRRYVSAAVRELLGWTQDEAMSRSFHDTHPEDIELVKSLFKHCRDSACETSLECRGIRSDGSYRWLELKPRLYSESEDGTPTGIVTVVRDVSQRKAEQEKQQRAYRIIEEMAKSDALTGVANRRQFDLVMEREWLRAIAEQSSISLLLIDVDKFKLYNDAFGHQGGDECLRRVATAAAATITRDSDIFARYGGEEFAVILPNTGSDGGKEVSERIRAAIEHLSLPHHANEPHMVVTLSIGCGTILPKAGQSSLQLMETADQALYLAKSLGRNRVQQSVVRQHNDSNLSGTAP